MIYLCDIYIYIHIYVVIYIYDIYIYIYISSLAYQPYDCAYIVKKIWG